MSCWEAIDNLFSEIIEKDKVFNEKIQTYWNETEKLNKNNIPIGHVIKFYILVINDMSAKTLLC